MFLAPSVFYILFNPVSAMIMNFDVTEMTNCYKIFQVLILSFCTYLVRTPDLALAYGPHFIWHGSIFENILKQQWHPWISFLLMLNYLI